MSDIHYVPPTFTKIVDDFKDAKGGKHVRSDDSKQLHVHGLKPSGIGKGAKEKRIEKQEAGARQVREAITRDYGPRVTEYLFRPNQRTITVTELRTMKAVLETDPKAHELAMFEFIKDEAEHASQIEAFLRGDTPRSSTMVGYLKAACGDYFTTLCGEGDAADRQWRRRLDDGE